MKQPSEFRFCPLLFLLLALLASACRGGENVTLERVAVNGAQTPDRTRIARTLYSHNFENVRDPDTGLLLPESAAINNTQWPDFWEPVRAVGYPEYLIPGIKIEPDLTGMIPGSYRDLPNHALRMDFDGTRIGIRTRTPIAIDPQLAYEYSLRVRDENLQGARIRTGIDWMRIDPAVVEVLRSDEIPNLLPGQNDWAVVPNRMLINDPPPAANAARLFVVVDRMPGSIGGAYHGSLWVDDIALKALPKIRIEAPIIAENGQDRIIPVHYAGLFDNVPDPNNPGFFRGKRYSRQVEITDVFGHTMNLRDSGRQPLEPGDDGNAVEEVPFPRDKYGVYYFNIRLYDAEATLATDVMRAVAVMRPERKREGLALQSYKPVFGVRAGIVPPAVLANQGLLRRMLESSGAKMTKIVPWQNNYENLAQNGNYFSNLVREIRQLRSAGVGITGVIKPPSARFGDLGIAEALAAQPDELTRILGEAGQQLGLFIDTWQWGDDSDGTFAQVGPGKNLEQITAALRDFAGGMPVAASVPLDGGEPSAFPMHMDILQGWIPEKEASERLWPLVAPVFPWLFEPYYNERGLIYPPHRLSRLSPPPAVDKLEEQARLMRRAGSWLSVEPAPANAHEPNAPAERVQLEDLAVRAVYAAILKPDVVFLGDLFDPAQGLLRQDANASTSLETMARPAYLAAGTIAELLEGAEYLGELWLLPPFQAHVFRRPGSDDAVVAIWHYDPRDEITLSRAEIASGPAMELIDWAGNRLNLTAGIPVRRVPSFITGLSANLMLTRMSLRINPDQPVLAMNQRQNQTVEMVNHMTRQAPVLLRLRFAARLPDGAMESNWMVRPEEIRINLPPFSPQLPSGKMRFVATPDPNSQIQRAGPNRSDKSGSKIAQVKLSVNTAPPADMTVYLPFRLQSDLDMDVEALNRINDPNFVTLQLKLRWFPSEATRRRGEIRVTPYYMKRGQMKEVMAFPVTLKASPPEQRGNPDAPFESVEMRIPRRPQIQTWVGLDEVGGSNFYLNDVTEFLRLE